MKRKPVLLLKLQFQNMVRGRTFYFTLLLMTVLTMLVGLQTVFAFQGKERMQLLPAWELWNGNYMSIGDTTNYSELLGMFCLLSSFFAPMAYGAFYYDNLKNGTAKSILARTSQKEYLCSGAAVVFAGGFLLLSIPFLFEQVLLFILCAGAPPQDAPYDEVVWLSLPMFLRPLQLNHPYLFNLLFSIAPALFAGVFAVLTFALSLYFHRNRFWVITLPAILICILPDYILDTICNTLRIKLNFSLLAYTIYFESKLSYYLYPVYVLGLILIDVLLIRHKYRVAKDVLE